MTEFGPPTALDMLKDDPGFGEFQGHARKSRDIRGERAVSHVPSN
jgi:hypothetical protein